MKQTRWKVGKECNGTLSQFPCPRPFLSPRGDEQISLLTEWPVLGEKKQQGQEGKKNARHTENGH